MDTIAFFNQHIQYFIDELKSIVSFRSISTDPQFKEDVEQASQWVQHKLETLGFDLEVIKTSSNPILIAKLITDPSLKTVLLYGHYDVQPVEPLTAWESDPFTLTERDDKFFARGVMDNKGQFMMHVSAIEAILKTHEKLPVNIIFLIEGDEETGSADLENTIQKYASKLKADVALISDGEMIKEDIPVIETSFRGVVNCELTIEGPKEDLHSGVAGGAIANPAFELASLIAKFYDDKYRVTIPHFYDDVEKITPEERQTILDKVSTEQDFLETTGAKQLIGEEGFHTFERTGLRPTLQITGITSGYGGIGFKNIVPATANAKFNFRLVTNQDPQKVYDNFVAFIRKHISPAVRYTISKPDMVAAVKIDLDNAYVKQAESMLEEVYGHKTQIVFVGGTLPVINAIKDSLNIPILSIPLSQEDCGMHAPNERLYKSAFQKGIEFSIKFLESL